MAARAGGAPLVGPLVIETLAAMLSACLVNSVLDAGERERGGAHVHSFIPMDDPPQSRG